VADALPLPYSSLKKYVRGRRIRVPEHRARIYKLTGIDTFRPDRSNLPSQQGAVPPTVQDTRKTRLAIEMRQWFSQQGNFHSIAEMARSVGIAESTLRDYFIGRALPTPKNLSILKKVTHLTFLDEILETAVCDRGSEPKVPVGRQTKGLLARLDAIKRSFGSLADELGCLVGEADSHVAAQSRAVDETPGGRSRSIAELLVRLKDELEFFKAGSAEDREAFRRAIPGEQLGYVVSLLKALYDEGAFREWLHFSQLDLTEKR